MRRSNAFIASLRRPAGFVLYVATVLGLSAYLTTGRVDLAIAAFTVAFPGALALWAGQLLLGVVRGFGQYVVGSRAGLSVYAISANPMHLRLLPNRKLGWIWGRSAHGAIWMWHENGEFDAVALRNMAIGGIVANFLSCLFFYDLTQIGLDPWPKLFASAMLWFSLGYSILDLLPTRFLTLRLDGYNLYQSLRDPDGFAERMTLDHVQFFTDRAISIPEWPQKLFSTVTRNTKSFSGKSRLFRYLFVNEMVDYGLSNFTVKIDAQLQEIELWPNTAEPHNAANEYRLFLAMYLATGLMNTRRASEVLPSASGLTWLQKQKREIVLAAIAVCDDDFASGRRMFYKANYAIRNPFQNFNDRVGLSIFRQQAMQILTLRQPRMEPLFQILRAANTGIRPRDWNLEWIVGLEGASTNPDYWPHCARAALAYWIDRGDAQAVERQIEKTIDSPNFAVQRKSFQARILGELACYLALSGQDIGRAQRRFADAERTGWGDLRAVRLARAAIFARTGRHEVALALADSVAAELAAVPSWCPPFPADLDRIAAIRALTRPKSLVAPPVIDSLPPPNPPIDPMTS